MVGIKQLGTEGGDNFESVVRSGCGSRGEKNDIHSYSPLTENRNSYTNYLQQTLSPYTLPTQN